ncbi:MAG TPA: hypothetical protein VJ853_03405 [Thermoanaerobaculia bacterium]|nr:hypothetical protein [Thermoanaerobaculia bacterium]
MARVRLGPRHIQQIEKRPDGSIAAKYDLVVSDDGKTLTIKHDQMDRQHPDAVRSSRTEIDERQPH